MPPSDRFSLRQRGITDERVIEAMNRVPREEFVPAPLRREADADGPLPIGHDQTISQPFIVAWMTATLAVESGARVLEVGTGSGYQTAILAELGADVWSIERIPELSARAETTLTRLGYAQVHLLVGNGYDGWPAAAPYDRVLLTAAPPSVPQTLIDQLADGGRLVAPVGVEWQVIVIVDRRGDEIRRRESLPVRFVEMKKDT